MAISSDILLVLAKNRFRVASVAGELKNPRSGITLASCCGVVKLITQLYRTYLSLRYVHYVCHARGAG